MQLINYLSNLSQETLLVLDAMAHKRGGFSLVLDILEKVPNVRFLVTSREHTGLTVGVSFALEGLGLPNTDFPEDVLDASSVQFFYPLSTSHSTGFCFDRRRTAIRRPDLPYDRRDTSPHRIGVGLGAGFLLPRNC